MVNTNRISDLFDIQKRFIRSTHLERDFADHTALRGYVVTPPAQEGFERLLQGLNPESGQRAWRVTGDYGTGKSSFALALAHLLSDGGGLPQDVRKCVDFRSLGVKRPNLLPVLVTGTRAPLGEALRMALAKSLEELCNRGKPPQIMSRLRCPAGKTAGEQDGSEEIALLLEAGRFLRSSGKADGLVLFWTRWASSWNSQHCTRTGRTFTCCKCLQKLPPAAVIRRYLWLACCIKVSALCGHAFPLCATGVGESGWPFRGTLL